MNEILKKTTLFPSNTISEGMEKLDLYGLQIIILIDKEFNLIGTVTDGDIRKGLMKGIKLSNKIIKVANLKPKFVNENTSKDEIIRLMKSIPKNIIVVLDGAYTEYVTNKDFDNSFSLLKKFNNIIFTRTFSKSYGLAGLRIGWCYSSPSIVDILNKVKGPFNTGLVSQEIAISALKDQKHINQIVKSNIEVKKWFEKELKKLNIVSKPSVANFSFIETTKKHAKKIASHLLSDGIVIRQLDSYNLPHCLRITIGTKKEMELVIKSLKKLL